MSLCLQYSYLLTSQLESQRIYWENKIVRIEKDTAEEVSSALGLWEGSWPCSVGEEGAAASLAEPGRRLPQPALLPAGKIGSEMDLSLIWLLPGSNLLLSGAEAGRLPQRLQLDLNVLLGKCSSGGAAGSWSHQSLRHGSPGNVGGAETI